MRCNGSNWAVYSPRELRWFQEWFMSPMSLMSRGNNAPWAPLSWWIRALYKSTYYYYYYKPLKKSFAIQVWGMISFLLLIYEKRNWYHWKAWLFLFTMMCHLPWLCNHGMCSTPEYRAKSEVKCCKMHCFGTYCETRTLPLNSFVSPADILTPFRAP